MRKSFRALAILAAIAATPIAFAQDANTSDTSTTPKRFSFVGGYAHMVPKSNPGSIAGQTADLDGNGAATLSGTWHVDDNWAVELWGTPDKIKTDVNLANGGRGEFKQQPIAVSGQYHFGQASRVELRCRTIRPDGRRRHAHRPRHAEGPDGHGRRRLQHHRPRVRARGCALSEGQRGCEGGWRAGG